MTALSRFTPSNVPPDVLRRLFVGRHRLLNALGDRIASAIDTEGRIHSLVVGPRGAGKTHLMSLVADHVSTLTEQGRAVQTAWLLEDPYLIGSYEDLLVEIITTLGVDVRRGTHRSDLETEIRAAYDRNGLIVVVLENLDEILDALGREGQHHLRHFLQADPSLLLMATTTAVTRDLNDEAWPFFGFFTTDYLEPLTTEQAADMLQRIATENGDEELLSYLATDEAAARLRAIEHLAGGQPRIWALLSSALTVEGLRELVDLLITELDALTPYYQEQMRRLSPLQRRTVAALIEAEGALTVAALADVVGVEQRSMAKTLTELRANNWVTTIASPFAAWVDRRRSYYELAEPLARIAFQIKSARATPIATIVDFAKMWFEPERLNDANEMIEELYLAAIRQAATTDAVGSVVRSLHALPTYRVPTLQVLERVDDAIHALAQHDAEPLLALPSPLRIALEDRLGDPTQEHFATRLDATRAEIARLALNEISDAPQPSAEPWIPRLERWLESTTARGLALFLLATLQGRLRHIDEAKQTLAAIDRIFGTDHPYSLAIRAYLMAVRDRDSAQTAKG